MIDREQLKKFLKLNGLSPKSSDKEIKAMFLSARWHEDDVETAILVLRKNPITKKQHMESLYKVFRYDDARLKPETISALLGIHIDVKGADVTRQRTKSSLHAIYKTVEIIFVSILISVVVFVGALWYFKTGIFHLGAA